MRLIDYFEHAHVINLQSRRDRLRDTYRQLARIGLGGDPRIHRFDAVRPTELAGFPTLGAHGCYLSHLGVLKLALASGVRRVWILEDDVKFVSGFVVAEEAIVEQLEARPDWSIVYFGHDHGHPDPGGDGGGLRGSAPTLVAVDRAPTCLHCYGVNASILEPLVRYLESCLVRPTGDPIGGPMHVDGAYDMFKRQNPASVTILKCMPRVATQRPSRTDIHDLGALDRIALTRPIMEFIRRLRAL